MTEPNRCPQCGSPLPLDAPRSICPRCVLALGFRPPPAANPLPATSPATPSGRFVPPKPHEIAPLFPQLEILDLLGTGGMGAVYTARQTKLDRLVALKILPPEVGQDPAFAERFAREARTLGRLAHPGIVGIYDFGQAGNLYYLLMEYVDGSNLRQVIEAGQISPPQALAIVPQVCEALQYAHDEGVVHRDIKPENILLDKKGRAKIADFGLAKLLSRPAGSFTLTDTQQVMGTPHYMAPEQFTSTRAVDHRADIYSLGVVFYEMLTGELPLGRFDPPSKKSGVDARLDEVVLRTLERTPERRYQQARAVKTDVESISRVRPPAAPMAAVGAPESFAWSWLGMALVFLVPALALIAFALFWTKSGWTLTALGLPWFAICFWSGYGDTARVNRVAATLATLLFLASLALIGCGVWLENSAGPLATVLICGAAAIAGGGIGHASKQQEASGSDAAAPNAAKEVKDKEWEYDDRDEAARPEVRTAFRGPTPEPVTDAPGPDGWPVKPEMPAVAAAQKPARGTIGRAWDAWWGQRDRWFTNIVQGLLAIVTLGCWICFLNFSLSTQATPGDAKLRHTTIRFGFPDSWFHLEKYPEPLVPFRWSIDYFSWTTLILLAGCVAWYVYWQIEKAKPDARYVWLGSANTIIIFWAVLSSLIVLATLLMPI